MQLPFLIILIHIGRDQCEWDFFHETTIDSKTNICSDDGELYIVNLTKCRFHKPNIIIFSSGIVFMRPIKISGKW